MKLLLENYLLRVKYLCDGSEAKPSPVECKETEQSTKLLRNHCHGGFKCNVTITTNFVQINADCLPVIKDITVDYTCSKY